MSFNQPITMNKELLKALLDIPMNECKKKRVAERTRLITLPLCI